MISKIEKVLDISKFSPVLVTDVSASMFGESTIIEGDIPSKKLGIISTASGIKTPSWFYEIVKGKASHQIIINNVDAIDKENQEKFYELLKYKAISDIKLPSDCTIIVTAKDLKNVSETIIRLCQIVK